MKVLFLTADLGGNVPPTLAIAEALKQHGVEVEIAGLRGGRTALPQIPFPVSTAIKPEGRSADLREIGKGRRLMMGRAASTEANRLIAERRPDLVVVDCMIPALIRGALESGRPVVVLFHTFGEFWVRSFDRGVAGRMLALLGLRPRQLWNRASARLIVTDDELDPGRSNLALADYVWTGTTETGAERRPRSADTARVLVSLSSTEFPGMLRVYRRVVTALLELPVEATVTTGGVDLGSELQGSGNVEIRKWVDHAELLPSIDLMIGHGGHSSTMKTLAHGVPLLVLPVNPIADQRLVGRVIRQEGLGECLTRRASPERIRDAIQRMLADDELRDRVRETGHRLRGLPLGAEVAAEHIIALMEARELG